MLYFEEHFSYYRKKKSTKFSIIVSGVSVFSDRLNHIYV